MDLPADTEVDADIRPGIAQLVGQLADDTRAFASAELAYLKAQAGERAGYAIPGIIAILVAVTLGLAAIIAVIIGIMLALAPVIGAGWAVFAVTMGALLIALLTGWWGAIRLRKATKPREHR
jgi:uncharacterized Tic20 family protein